MGLARRTFAVKEKKERYKSGRLRVFDYRVERDGSESDYAVVTRSDSVVIIPRTQHGAYLLMRSYRFPTEAFSWELPMGGVKSGETPSAAAARELEEETNLSSQLEHVGRFHPVPGLTPQRVDVFTTTIPAMGPAELDRPSSHMDDIVERRLIGVERLAEMLDAGDISDGFTLSSLALYWASTENRHV